MRTKIIFLKIIILVICFFTTGVSFAYVKGIYLTQSTAENAKKVSDLIQQAKSAGLNTFVIDANYKSNSYAKNIERIQRSGIRYVARIVVFPEGGLAAHIKSKAYWEKRWQQAAYAISLGADEIQLDYIRYKASQRPSHQNAKDIYQVINFFDQKLHGSSTQLQIDIFGVAADQPSLAIGQNVPLFADVIDVICPMVYPSHYEPHPIPSRNPYQTVFNSVTALKRQLRNHPHVKIYAFIEEKNYRYPMSFEQRKKYIHAQMRGALDAGAAGWYVWSPHNVYNALFALLRGS